MNMLKNLILSDSPIEFHEISDKQLRFNCIEFAIRIKESTSDIIIQAEPISSLANGIYLFIKDGTVSKP